MRSGFTPSNKEERWDDVYEIIVIIGQISCLIEDKFYSEKHKTIEQKYIYKRGTLNMKKFDFAK